MFVELDHARRDWAAAAGETVTYHALLSRALRRDRGRAAPLLARAGRRRRARADQNQPVLLRRRGGLLFQEHESGTQSATRVTSSWPRPGRHRGDGLPVLFDHAEGAQASATKSGTGMSGAGEQALAMTDLMAYFADRLPASATAGRFVSAPDHRLPRVVEPTLQARSIPSSWRRSSARSATLPVAGDGAEHMDAVARSGHPPIMAFWHGRILAATLTSRIAGRRRDQRHFDGDDRRGHPPLRLRQRAWIVRRAAGPGRSSSCAS